MYIYETVNERLSPSCTCALCRAHTHIIDTVSNNRSYLPTHVYQSVNQTNWFYCCFFFPMSNTYAPLAQQFTFIRCARAFASGAAPSEQVSVTSAAAVYFCTIVSRASAIRFRAFDARVRALTRRFSAHMCCLVRVCHKTVNVCRRRGRATAVREAIAKCECMRNE